MKPFYTGSDIFYGIATPDSIPTEPLVLGNQLLAMLGLFIDMMKSIVDGLIAGPIGIGNLGAPVYLYPSLAMTFGIVSTGLAALKSQYVSNPLTNVVSLFAYTERGIL